MMPHQPSPNLDVDATVAHHTECDGYGRGFSVRWVGWLAAAIGLALVPVAAYAENLLDREPFDLIQLDEANGKKKYEVLPIPFPNRRLPAGLPRSGTLDVRFVRAPTRLYKVRWANIAEIY